MAFLLAVSACSSKRPSECFIGDVSADPELVLVTRSLAGRAIQVAEGGDVLLIQPPQGGKVVFVGARARNVTCLVQITASIRDEASGRIAGTEGRPTTLVAGTDGWAAPDQPEEISNYANISACPGGNLALAQDMYDRPYVLRLRLEDGRGRTASTELRVVPRCGEPGREAQCRCECAASYVLGAACVGTGPDGGTDNDGGTSDGGAG